MRYDAKNETWMPMEIKGVEGYFNDMRIDRNTMPDCFHIWELADDDSDGMPCCYRACNYEAGILVNFYGTFITTEEMPVDDIEWNEGYIHSEDEWNFTGDRYHPFSYILNLELKKKVDAG